MNQTEIPNEETKVDTINYMMPEQITAIARDGQGLVAVIRSSDMRVVFANRQFERYLGYAYDEVQAQKVYFTDIIEYYQTDRLLCQLNEIRDIITRRDTFSIYRLKSRTGEYMSFYLYASPIPLGDGSEEYFHIVLHPDLSRWGMPFMSFETKELFLEQLDAEDFGTFEVVVDADRVYWSAGTYKIYEVDPSVVDISSQYARSFIHPADRARMMDGASAVFAGSSDMNTEMRIVSGRKNVKLLHVLSRVVRDSGGRPVRYIGTIRDITNKRRIENDLKTKVDALYHSNKDLEEFAYVASHDMQEPLRKITTFSDRLSEKYKSVLEGDGAMYLSRIIASAENMRRLINDLLEFSRISKSVQPHEKVNLDFILRQVRTDLELIVEETGTVINAPRLPFVDGVPSQMKQLLTNIISNAIKFRKPGVVPVIDIHIGKPEEEELVRLQLDTRIRYCKLEIADNGIGFDKEYANRIFQVFQRLHGKSEYPGSGIGLAICKKIMDNHFGAIYADSTAGEGAKFIIVIPEHQSEPLA